MSFAQVEKATGRKPKALVELESVDKNKPDELQYLFDWWTEAVAEKPLSWTELQAWANMTGKHPCGWEAEVLKSLDREFHKQWTSQVSQST